ncbi:MAG: PilZ domain-containing protein [Clostridiales bacterium]|nr:PilZ domain-containing protein [Clostridiales bacterium]
MLDLIDEYSKAQVFSSEKVLLGKVEILKKLGDKKILLRVRDDVVNLLYTSFIITVSNDVHGLVTYKANLLEFKKESESDKTYDVVCELVEMLEIIQRRENFKIKVLIPTTISVYDNANKPVLDGFRNHLKLPAEIRDISASGVFVQTKADLRIGQVIEFMFDKAGQPFPLAAEIIRSKKYESGLVGFGCKFINLPEVNESSIRRYIFKLQLAKVKEK